MNSFDHEGMARQEDRGGLSVGAGNDPGVMPGIHTSIHEINAPSPGAFSIPVCAGAQRLSTSSSESRPCVRRKESLDLLQPTLQDGDAVPVSWSALRRGDEAHSAGGDSVVRFLVQASVGGDDPKIVAPFVEPLARTHPMPNGLTAMGRESSHNRQMTATDSGSRKATSTMAAPRELPGEEPSPAFNEPAAAWTPPTKMGRGDDCQEIRDLMPGHLLDALSDELDQKLIDHVRTCGDCYSILTALRIGLEVAAAESKEARKPR